jgi:CspA family cold shock protein
MSFKNAVTSSVARDTLTGRVKWFNNKAGYGFITVTDGSRAGSDIFVHHSGINVENQQYKYLVQGEYVDFVLEKTESGSHEYHASNVYGVKGGKLMCETRRDFKIARSVFKTNKTGSSSTTDVNIDEPNTPRQTRVPKQTAPRSRGEGPRESEGDKKEWTTVVRSRPVENQTEKQPGRGRGRPPRVVTTSK